MRSTASTGGVVFKYRTHWHVWLTHFPISFFVAAFVFQILHLLPQFSSSFEMATNVMLIAGTAAMVPVTITGWFTWKRHYGGAWGAAFPRKVIISFIMLGMSIILTIWRTVFSSMFADVANNPWHWLYLIGNVLLMIGAVLEGFYGLRLSHK